MNEPAEAGYDTAERPGGIARARAGDWCYRSRNRAKVSSTSLRIFSSIEYSLPLTQFPCFGSYARGRLPSTSKRVCRLDYADPRKLRGPESSHGSHSSNPWDLRVLSGVGAFLRLFVLPPCFFTLCRNVNRGLTGRGVHLLVAWLLVLANASGTLTDAIANPSANSTLFMLMASYSW
jgi:hypothetical protein